MTLPLKNYSSERAPKGLVTQYFGQNPSLYAHMGMIGHNGVDYVQPHGSPMYAVEDGYIVEVNNHPEGFGRHVRFISRKTNKNGFYNEWTYGHCHKIHVAQNALVRAGDHIADMGNTGFVVSGNTPFWNTNPYAGTHLHLGLREVERDSNGWSYPGSKIKISVRNYQNGYRGAIDPIPFLETVTVPVEDPRIPLMKQVVSLLETLLALKLKK